MNITNDWKEKQYYPEISEWAKQYLIDKYKDFEVFVTYETSWKKLDAVLLKYWIDNPLAKWLDIEVDIVGIMKKWNENKLAFFEIKDKPLTLLNLWQLRWYSQLMDPQEAFLISTKGLGTLWKCLIDLKRTDILEYWISKAKKMRVAKWDTLKKSIEYTTLV